MSRADEPAYPVLAEDCQRVNESAMHPGLTIRELFVKDIFCAFIARGHRFERSRNQAIEQADALLAALQRPQRGEGE